MSDITTEKIRKAWKLFKSFHNKDPRGSQVVSVGMEKPDEALEVGKFFGIAYIAEGEIYFHKFNKRNRPLVYVSADGKQIYILKGGYRFTDRGFIG